MTVQPMNPRKHLRPRRMRADGTFWLLVLITLAGLGFRLSMVSERNWSKADSAFQLEGDEGGYDGLAIDLLHGRFFLWPFRVPVYPMFLAGIYWAFGHSPAAAIVAQAFLGAGLIPLTYWLGRYVTRRPAAMIGAGLVAANYEMAYQTTRLYTEVLYTALLLLTLISFHRAIIRPTVKRFGLAGVILGLLNLCRPTGALLPAAMALAMPWRWNISHRAKWIAVYAIAMILPIAPWTLHNYRQHHVFLPLAVSTAVLWQGSPEFYHRFESGKTLLDIWKTDLNPTVNGGHSPHTVEGDRWFTKRAIQSIKAEPGLWARYCLQKSAYLWIGNPAIDWPWAYRKDYPIGRAFGILTCRVIVGLGAVSLLVLAWKSKLRRFVPQLMVMAYVTAIHAITYPEARYSYPLHVCLSLMIGAAIVEGWSLSRRCETD